MFALKQIIFWDLLGISFPINITDICYLNFPLKQKKNSREKLDYIFSTGTVQQVKYKKMHILIAMDKEEDMQRQEKNKGLKNILQTPTTLDWLLLGDLSTNNYCI